MLPKRLLSLLTFSILTRPGYAAAIFGHNYNAPREESKGLRDSNGLRADRSAV